MLLRWQFPCIPILRKMWQVTKLLLKLLSKPFLMLFVPLSVHHTLRLSPGAIVFARDMLLDIPFVADLIQLRHKRQVLIHHNLRRENNRHHKFDSIVENYVFEILKMGLSDSKLGLKTRGPYRIEQVHANGTFTIHRRPGVIDRVNIRRLRPAYTR